MASNQYSDQKRPLVDSKKKIDKAAQKIRHGAEGEERLDAIKTIQGYREFHLYPLMLLKNHLVRTARKVSPDVIVARRLKRLPTIINKLERPTLDGKSENAIKLTRMQDIAGCRAIVRSPKDLYALKKRLERSRSVHTIVRSSDYLISPKSSGYGGIHLIYSCYAGQEESHDWKGALVEVQLRTQLQHAWATSLEIIDTLENIELKTSVSNYKDWREFFSLAGQLVADKENFCKLSYNDKMIIGARLSILDYELDVSRKLTQYNFAINITENSDIPQNLRSAKGMFLIKVLTVREEKYKLELSYYSELEAKEALEKLNESELDANIAMSVLVSAEGVRALKQAYPNYFGDTQMFIDFLMDVKSTTRKDSIQLAQKIISNGEIDPDTGERYDEELINAARRVLDDTGSDVLE